MKKRLFIIGSILIIICVIGALIAIKCNSKESKQETEENTNSEEQTSPIVDETLVKIDDIEFHLDKEATYKDIKYTISGDFKEANLNKYIQYNYYKEDNTNLLFFRIFYYGEKSIEEAIKDLGLENNIVFSDGKTEKIEYKYYAKPRDDGGTIHFYFINKDNNLYVLHFASKYDIKDFEEKVIKSISF